MPVLSETWMGAVHDPEPNVFVDMKIALPLEVNSCQTAKCLPLAASEVSEICPAHIDASAARRTGGSQVVPEVTLSRTHTEGCVVAPLTHAAATFPPAADRSLIQRRG